MALVKGRIVADSPTKVALDEAWRTGEMPADRARTFARDGLVVLARDVAYSSGSRTHVRLTPKGRRARRSA